MEKILPFIKKGGYALFVVPGLKEEPKCEMKSLMDEWATDDAYMFKTKEWWAEHIAKNCCNF